ncbi:MULTISPECIES: hypothetical protein [unclassified Aureimonas]|uniref:hypothetical protein n=1 Tax=unclassified Aureimonas TaxID=2615206 RepID=UPI0006FF4043|nr:MULTISPECIES: hypothetical protein [unclassified Aureimonas]KQT64449.1 hypothetical protein ASG62_05705 [Aureimonas sp. Leaf427]KQT81637.1 hypothetical protein ASG54_02985 [Aureimonas sp. Leaf460]
MSQTALRNDNADDLDFVVDEAIRVAGGDMRTAILSLIRGQHQPEAQMDKTASSMTPGYARRQMR